MEEASNTCIVAFQLMQVIDLQTIQIMARFCQGDILAMKRIQYGARKCVAENVRGFSVAVLPAAPHVFRSAFNHSSNSEICRGRSPSFTWTRNVSGTSRCPANAFASLSSP